MDEPWFCYMLQCSDGSFYVGITDDIEERLWKHNRGKGPEYTAKRRPVKLVWHQEFASQQDARRREEEIKGWSRRKKLELIRKVKRSAKQVGAQPCGAVEGVNDRPSARPEGANAVSDRRIDKTEWRRD